MALEEEVIQNVYELIEIVLKRNIVRNRWRWVSQVLILKDPPESKIHLFWCAERHAHSAHGVTLGEVIFYLR